MIDEYCSTGRSMVFIGNFYIQNLKAGNRGQWSILPLSSLEGTWKLLIPPTCAIFILLSQWLKKCQRGKTLDPRNTHEEKFGATKYPQEKILDPQKIHEKKIWIHETSRVKILGPRNSLRDKTLNPRNTHTRKNFGPTKAPWHDGMRPTRPTMARDP